MPVYTSFEMIEDCKAGKPAGWIHLVRNFVSPFRWLLGRYGKGEPELRQLLSGLKTGIARYQPMVQREFIAEFRPHPPATGPLPVELSELTEAFADLSVLERQNVWFDTMGYDIPDTARLLRTTPETAQKARDKGAELLRGKLDSWTRTLLRDYGGALGHAARAAKPEQTVPFREYLDIIDGRMTWQNRVGVERALLEHWYEIDQFCRVREADAALTETKPLTDDEMKPYLDLLGVSLPKPSLWKRLAG